ncbi:amidase family protein [Hoeflea sp. CAU 1731]
MQMVPYWSMPANAISALVRARAVSASEVVENALARMESVNPTVNAVVDSLAGPALTEAKALDTKLAAGDDGGPLAGVPITVKVSVDLAGRPTTSGLRLQADLIAEQDSPVVANLRRSGAIIIGRTNTPAFSLRWFTRNTLHGATRNPHNSAYTPGGSSGGAAAAVATGIGAVGHGTDIAGSIRYPAYACGVHGLRPTLGRVPAAHLSGPERTIGAQLMGVSGPLARTIDDLELGFRAMSAGDARDPWWMPVPHTMPTTARRVALSVGPDSLVVAPPVRAALEAAAHRLEKAGWEVAQVNPPSFRDAAAVNISLWMDSFRSAGLSKLEAENDPDALTIVERLMAVAERAPRPEEALRMRATLLRAWQLFLEEWPLVLCPVSSEPPFPDHLDVGTEADFERVYEAQLTQSAIPALGLPALAVATGRPGAPMGVQLVAGRFREDILFKAGRIVAAPVSTIDPAAEGHGKLSV